MGKPVSRIFFIFFFVMLLLFIYYLSRQRKSRAAMRGAGLCVSAATRALPRGGGGGPGGFPVLPSPLPRGHGSRYPTPDPGWAAEPLLLPAFPTGSAGGGCAALGKCSSDRSLPPCPGG